MKEKILQIMNEMRDTLPQKRFVHTLGVAYLAASLSMAYGKNAEKAMLAGLLHDCAKCIPEEEILKKCLKYGIPVSEIERKQPYLLHGKLGAWYAENKYDISDEKILNAIRFHTTGRPDMCFLEKNIYLSDYIEIGREQPIQPPLNELRRIAFQDIDLAVYYTAKNTVDFLLSKENGREKLDETSLATLEFYAQKTGRKS